MTELNAEPTATLSMAGAHSEGAPVPHSLGTQLGNLAAVVVPFVGLIAALVLLWGRGLSGIDLSLLVGMYLLTGLGITVGFHRLFTHRAFETHRGVEALLAALGSMAVQGPLLGWVATHRRHHQHSDQEDDPHSPLHHGAGLGGLLRGAWHAHIGWAFQPDPPHMRRYVKDLRQSRLLRAMSALFPVWVAVSLLIPTLLGGLLTGTWRGALSAFLWGGLVRIFLVHHVTWSVNSVCHLWGRRPFPVRDESKNNFVFGILALGEGWHNNHHAFPTSARHGLRWWQIDLSYWAIRALALLGLAWEVRLPAKPAMAGPGDGNGRDRPMLREADTVSGGTSPISDRKSVSRSLSIRRIVMGLFAALELHPGGIVGWVAIGLFTGWLAGKFLGGGNSVLVLNVALGLMGALMGGFLFGLIMQSETGVGGESGFWTSLAIAFVGSCLLLAVVRHMGMGHKA